MLSGIMYLTYLPEQGKLKEAGAWNACLYFHVCTGVVSVYYGLLQFGIIIVWPFMHFYNGTRGKAKWMKWFFYVFYVGHLILCGFLRLALHGNVGTIIGG